MKLLTGRAQMFADVRTYSFLFAGDIEKQRIADMLSQGRVQPCDFLKVPHHGVYNSKLEDYFSKVNMKYAVITCSDKNPAEQKTLDLLSIQPVSA